MFKRSALALALTLGVSGCGGHDGSERESVPDEVGEEEGVALDVQGTSDCGSGLMVLGKGCCYCYSGDYHGLNAKCSAEAKGHTFTYDAFCFE